MDVPLRHVYHELRNAWPDRLDLPLALHTFGLVVIANSAGVAVGLLLIHGLTPFFPLAAVAGGVGIVCGSLACPRLYAKRYRREQDCQQCGYDLTGNESGMCPECGAPIPSEQRTLLERQGTSAS